ncbi:hypothetical protein M3Y99_00074300 [Aphelenchoides fujianensis]|nr:hypothetical protein M3Y99_00074300 [Aphelenchoides fujianensis]
MSNLSHVWKYWRKEKEPTRMHCLLCNCVLSTNNAGNGKKHMKYKHKAEYEEVQRLDDEMRDPLKRPLPAGSSMLGVPKKRAKEDQDLGLGNELFSFEQLTSFLLPSLAAETPPVEEEKVEPPPEQPEVANGDANLLNKSLKLRAVELLIDVEGQEEPVRLSFPCGQSTNVASILAQLL